MLNIDLAGKLNLKADDFAGQRVAVLGISGGGKTNTSAVLVEELLPFMPMSIVDIEGEYWGLTEKHDMLIVGRSEHSSLYVSAANASALAAFAYDNDLSVILDFSGHDEDEMFMFIHDYFETLWRRAVKGRKPYGVVLEECHEFIPQVGDTPVKTLFKRYSKRGRKQGITLILSSQRSSEVDKGVLTQAGLVFLHRVTHPTDKGVYRKFIPMKPAEVDSMVSELRPGQAVVIHEHEPVTAQIRKRHTFHAGFTPSLDTQAIDGPALRKVDAALIEKLQAQFGKAAEPSTEGKQAIRIAELERENKELRSKTSGDGSAYQTSRIKILEGQVKAVTEERDTLKLKLATVEAERDRARSQHNVNLQTLSEIHKMLTEVMAKVESIEDVHDNLDLIATKAAASAARPGYDEVVPADTESDDGVYRSERAIKLAQGRQRRNLERVLAIVREQTPANRCAFAVLVDNPDKALTVNDLARLTGYSPNTIRLTPFVEAGLLTRNGRGRYRSHVDSFVGSEFPDLSSEEVLAQLSQ